MGGGIGAIGGETIMKLYAYVRVSTTKQSLQQQIDNIMSTDNGICAGATFFSDKYTGSTLDRPAWLRLCKRLQPGDTVVFDSVSRMSRDAEAALCGKTKTYGVVPGTKLATKKSIAAKEVILKHTKDFGGTLTNPEFIKLTGISRNT